MECRFVGTLDGRPAESFRGTQERAGARAYLLLGVKAQGSDDRWIVDLEGIDGVGPGKMEVTMVAPDGTRYRGRASGTVRADGPRRIVDHVRFEAHGDGTRVLEGGFAWEVDESLPREVLGELRLQVDGREIGPVPATLAPFGDAWQTQVTAVLGPGESTTVTLRVPAPGNGRWSGDAVGLSLVWTKLGDALDMDVRHLEGTELEARGSLEGDAAFFQVRGRLVDPGHEDRIVAARLTGRLVR